MKAPKKHKKGCGCSGSSSDEKTPALEQPAYAAYERDAAETALLSKKFARPVETPSTTPRTRIFKQPEALSEIVLQSPGTIPVRAVVPTREAVPELVEKLKENVREIPAPPVKEGRGAIDVKLENRDGAHVKSGTVTLNGPQGKVAVPLDPTSRRFRVNDLPPGAYTVEAASASAGRGLLRVNVRADDVTRSAISLDGSTLKGTTSVRFSVRGSESARMNIRATDSATGRRVFEGVVEAQNGVFQLDRVPFGKLHFDMDDENAKSCYDAEVNDNIFELPPLEVELNPSIPIGPDPPEWRFDGLGWELGGVASVLPALDINSIEELANAEPEALMHRALEKGTEDITPVHSRLFAQAIDQARYSLGMRKAVGEQTSQLRLGDGRTFTRSFLPRNSGDSEIEINLGPGKQGELTLDGPSGTDKRSFTGSTVVKFKVSKEDIAAGRTFDLSLKNTSGSAIKGNLVAKLATDVVSPGFFFAPPSVEERIESILESLAVQNPGLGTSLPGAVTAPENIEMWMDRARTFMSAAGVCSMNDLGRCRFNSSTVLTPGAYVAPVVQPPSGGVITALNNYVFSHVLANSILYYIPNDILHDTAVILAGEWDLRGQTIILGHEVRELVVVVGSIRHDGASRITWETLTLPAANSYWPNPANRGPNGVGPGAAGIDGEDGDQNPHPSKNGGANAPVPGPTITMYIRDSTNNIPPIDLRGQNGGRGGRGQDGGRGGDGDCGLRADGTFFGGCCRGVGFGGNGGQGGDGGRGGKGGSGGGGGRITILTTAPGIAVLQASPPSMDVNGGAGGPGGDPGTPANGGTGGPAGTADCETWCDEHPERRGNDGARGSDGSTGFTGDAGPGVVEDAIQILPITDEQWQEEFNRPHILDVDPDEVEPGQTVQIRGQNFIPGTHRVYFDGFNVGPVTSTTQASFVVPTTSEGGYHPVVIRNPSDAAQRSNRVMLLVVPVLDAIPAGTRFVENQNITLTGLAFKTGLQLLAEDRSVPPASYVLPVIGVTRTAINAQIPGGFLGSLRGVRRLVVRNPEGGTSRAERVARISDTIVVRCAAFRVTGNTAGVGTTRSAADITNLFTEGAVNSLSIPWGAARIVFRLVQPVATINVADDIANLWPIVNTTTDMTTFNNAPGVLGALNFFFVRDVDIATAYAYFGGGPIFVGDEGSPLGLVDFQQVVAHEIGHALCLRHQCDGSGGESPGTFFDRDCEDGDEAFLMYPFWDTSDGMALAAGQIDPARIGATNFEDGKINPLPVASLFQTALPPTLAQCLAADLTD